MSYGKTRNCRRVASALVVAMLASLVPHQAAHAEAADHHAPAATEAVVAVQSASCQYTRCVRVTAFGRMCEACDCTWTYEDENGNLRLGRDHWIRCGVM